MCRIGRLTKRSSLLLIAAVTVFAAASRLNAVEIPVEGRPADFTGIAGVYTIEVLVDRTDVAVGEPIELTLRIRGGGPPRHEPSRPGIDKVVEPLKSDFDIEPMPDLDHIDRGAGEWKFRYLLRPKGTHVRGVPVLWLSYYLYRPPLERFVRRPSIAIPLRVRARLPVIVAPHEFYAISKGNALLRSAPPDRIRWEWLFALGAGVPLAALGIVLLMRRLDRGGSKRDEMSIEAIEAIEAVQACREGDRLAMYAAAWTYLQRRGSPPAEPTVQRSRRNDPSLTASDASARALARLEAAVFGPPELAHDVPTRREVIAWIRQVDRTWLES